MPNSIKAFWKLARPYWVSKDRWRARTLLAAVIVLTFGSIFLIVQLNNWNGRLFDALQHFDKARLPALAGQFALIVFGHITVGVYTQYLTQLLQIRWREWMTHDLLEKWLEDRTFYLMQISDAQVENPDQRLAEDIKEFIDLSLNLSLGVLRQTITLFSFVGILWAFSGIVHLYLGGVTLAIPGYLAIASVLYATLGSLLTHKIGRNLTSINYNQQRYEADFRFSLVRVRENSDSIALSRGEGAESRFIANKFRFIINNFTDLITKQKQLGFFTSLFNNASQLVPLLLVTPRYFSKTIELGGCMQTINSFGRVENALSWFINNYVEWSHWRAVIQRLEGFDDSIKRSSALKTRVKEITNTEDQSDVSVSALTLQLPTNEDLLRKINFTITKGSSVLLHGPSGCGKSTLLRTLSGTWPYATGTVTFPPEAKCMVIPQKPYLPVDTLRAALTYPNSEVSTPQPELLELLNLARLPHLVAKLDQTENWSQILSPGEQQRIALLRVFQVKPDWLFLDEATSALDEDTQALLYRSIKQRLPGITIVSIAHRASLLQLHDLHFDVSRGIWTHPI